MAVSGKITGRAARGAVVLAALAWAAHATGDEVRRCEDESGHITYSNQACPTGTARERGVDNRPAVEVPHDPAADKGAKSALTVKAGNTVPGENVEAKNPERAKELNGEKNKAHIARCDDLAHRIEFAQEDALTADTAERASKELNLHRLQEEQKADCAPKS